MILKKEERFPFAVYLPFFLLFTALVAATFGDLVFSDRFYWGNNAFVDLFDVIGKAPGYLLLAFAASVLVRCLPKRNTARCRWLRYLYIMINAGALCLFVFSVSERIPWRLLHFGVSVIGGLLLSVLNISLVLRLPRETAKRLEKWSVLTVLLVGCVVAITGGLKLVWGRVRYNDLIEMGGEYAKQFTPWYKPHHSGGGDSFPSGHTALAACLLTLPLLLKCLDVKKWAYWLAFGLSAAFILATPWSRMMGGYHFLSDVTISLGLTYTLYIVLYFLFFFRKSVYFTANTRLQRALLWGSERLELDAPPPAAPETAPEEIPPPPVVDGTKNTRTEKAPE